MNVHVPAPGARKPKASPKALTPADLARRSFWSNDPLNLAYQRHHGWTDDAGVFHMANGFSLRQLIEFAEGLPPEILAEYAAQAGTGEQGPTLGVIDDTLLAEFLSIEA